MTAERERVLQLRAKADEILAGLPAWDGEVPAVLVTVVDPVTRDRIGHRFVPAAAAPQPRSRHLHAVRDAS